MTGPPRDWDKEMAEIDKISAVQPAAPTGRPAASGTGAPPTRQETLPPALRGGRTALTAWVRVALGVAVAVGVTQWPYLHACGLAAYGYAAAAGGVVLAGLWGAVTSWKRRMGLAHVVSLLVALWGSVLLGKAVLDRTAYVDTPLTWSC
jgi:hypothetical protein